MVDIGISCRAVFLLRSWYSVALGTVRRCLCCRCGCRARLPVYSAAEIRPASVRLLCASAVGLCRILDGCRRSGSGAPRSCPGVLPGIGSRAPCAPAPVRAPPASDPVHAAAAIPCRILGTVPAGSAPPGCADQCAELRPVLRWIPPSAAELLRPAADLDPVRARRPRPISCARVGIGSRAHRARRPLVYWLVYWLVYRIPRASELLRPDPRRLPYGAGVSLLRSAAGLHRSLLIFSPGVAAVALDPVHRARLRRSERRAHRSCSGAVPRLCLCCGPSGSSARRSAAAAAALCRILGGRICSALLPLLQKAFKL